MTIPPHGDPAIDRVPSRDDPGVPMSGAEELAVVTRSGFIESRHLGHGVVVDADGDVVVAMGDPQAPCNPRSSLKPVQAATCLLSGAGLTGAALGISAASHRGHPDHVDLVTAVLEGGGLDLDDLQTPPAWPSEDWARDDLARAGGTPGPVWHECSGKHAGMLRACVASGWDTSTYRHPDHALQRRIASMVERVTGVPVDHVGVDGCGAPLFTTTLDGLARAIGAVARHAASADAASWPPPGTSVVWPPADDDVARALGRVGHAMRAHPWTVAGLGAEDTVVMQEVPGLVAKGGAEGVMALGTADGIGVVVKVLDGDNRAAMPTALALLASSGLEVQDVADAVATASLGHGVPVGRVHASPVLRDRVAEASAPSRTP